jgi:hypothetical protein
LKAGPVAGAGQLIAEKVLGQKPLTQPNYLIRKFLSDLPDPTPQTPSAPTVLPSNAPQIPANVPQSGVAIPQVTLPPEIQRILALTRGQQ